jgi:hypothetical protein
MKCLRDRLAVIERMRGEPLKKLDFLTTGRPGREKFEVQARARRRMISGMHDEERNRRKRGAV